MMNRILICAAATAGALLLAACGSNNTSDNQSSAHPEMTRMTMSSSPAAKASATGTPASGPHNRQDVSFATDMIAHHAQAVTMADLALAKAADATVKELATSVKAAQAPEIATMSGWLTGWQQPVPSASMPMNHTGRPMPGMMSEADMAALDRAKGTAFDQLWLSQMITHHKGAVTMAETELTGGQNPPAKALAQAIITSQRKEIVRMTHLLPTIGN